MILLQPEDAYRRRYMPFIVIAPAAPSITDNGGWGQPLSATLRIHSDMLALGAGQILKGVATAAALANPISAPVLTAGISGFIPNGIYTVGYSYLSVYGETLLSPTEDITLSDGSTNSIVVGTLTVPTGTISVKWYMSPVTGSDDLRQLTTHAPSSFSLVSLPADDGFVPLEINTSGGVAHAEKATLVAGTGMEVALTDTTVTFNYNPTTPTDQNGFPLRRLRIENFTTGTLPTGLGINDKGRVVYDTTVPATKIWDGTDWALVAGSVSTGSVSGDLSGSLPDPLVVRIQGIPVSDTLPSDGQVMTYNSTDNLWRPVTFSPSSNATSIRGRPVSATTPTNGQALIFNGTSYVPQTIVASSGNATTVASIPVSAVAPSIGQILVYDGTAYVPSDIVAATGNANSIGGIGVGSSTPTTGQVLTFDGTEWNPADSTGGGGGDSTSIQSIPVDPTPPNPGQVLAYDGSNYVPTDMSSGGGGGGTGEFTGVNLYNTTNQTIPDSTFTILSFDTTVDDSDSYYDSGTPTRITIPTGQAGHYLISVRGNYFTNSTGRRRLDVYKNNSNLIANNVEAWPVNFTYLNTLGTHDLVEGDYLEVYAWQDSGGDLDFLTDGEEAPYFSVTKLALPTALDANAISIQSIPVDPLTPTEADVLTYLGGTWIPAPTSSGGSSDSASIQGIPVDATPPDVGQALVYDGTNYVPTDISGGGGGGGITPADDPTTDGQVLTYNGVDYVWKMPGQNQTSIIISQSKTYDASSTNSSGGYDAANAFSGDGATSVWESDTSGAPYSLSVDLGEPLEIIQWDVFNNLSFEGTGTRNRAYELQYSDDNSSWTMIDSVSGNSATQTSRVISSPVSAQYWRLYITLTGTSTSKAHVAEFTLYTPLPFTILGSMGITGLPIAGDILIADNSSELHWGKITNLHGKYISTVNQSIADSTTDLVTLSTKNYDTFGDRLGANIDGITMNLLSMYGLTDGATICDIGCSVTFDANATGSRTVRLTVGSGAIGFGTYNRDVILLESTVDANAVGPTTINLTTDHNFVNGGGGNCFFAIEIEQTSGGALDLLSGSAVWYHVV